MDAMIYILDSSLLLQEEFLFDGGKYAYVSWAYVSTQLVGLA
jgi:hypothetical protein